MKEGVYRIAGHDVQIRSRFDRVHDMCREYASPSEAEASFCPTMDEILREQTISDCENRLEGHPIQQFPMDCLEDLAVYRKIARWMVDRDTLLMHGSVIAVDGQAYMFTAKSGTGKSTHTRLWRELLGDRAVMVNDDKPLLYIRDGSVIAYGTPWNGKHRLGNNISAPLKGIAVINRGAKNTIHPATAPMVLPMLIQQSYRPEDAAGMEKVMELLDRLCRQVPVWKLTCNMEQDAARTAFKAMSNWKGENRQ